MEAKQLAKILSRLGLVLLALFAVLVAVDSLPLKLLDPDWILNTTATMVNLVTIPLVGVAFIHLAGFLSESTHFKLQRSIARLAGVLSLVFCLILPMLGFAVVKNISDLKASNQRTIQVITRKGSDLKQAVQSAASFNDLKTQMQRLNGPQIGDAAQTVPLPELKKELLKVLDQAEAAIPAQMIQANSPTFFPVYKRVFRTGLVGLLGALGFGLLAWDPINKKNVIASYFNLAPLSSSSIKKVLAVKLENAKQALQQRSNKAMARESWKKMQANQRKAQLQQEKEKRRNEAEVRKLRDRMKRQAEQQKKSTDQMR